MRFCGIFSSSSGIVYFYRNERHKLFKKYEGENVYQVPFVDTKTMMYHVIKSLQLGVIYICHYNLMEFSFTNQKTLHILRNCIFSKILTHFYIFSSCFCRYTPLRNGSIVWSHHSGKTSKQFTAHHITLRKQKQASKGLSFWEIQSEYDNDRYSAIRSSHHIAKSTRRAQLHVVFLMLFPVGVSDLFWK